MGPFTLPRSFADHYLAERRRYEWRCENEPERLTLRDHDAYRELRLEAIRRRIGFSGGDD